MTDSLSPAQRVLRAQVAVHESWANTADRTARTQPGRDKFMSRFVEEAKRRHPDANDETITLVAESLKQAYFARLAYASVKARRAAG